MNEHFSLILVISLAVLSIIFKIYKTGFRDVMTLVLLFYFFFSFGPIVNYIFDLPIYFGTVKENIFETSLIFLLATCSMVAMSVFMKPDVEGFKNAAVKKYENTRVLQLAQMVFIAIGLVQITRVLMVYGISKVELVAYLHPKIHYNYLLIQIYLVSFYFIVKSTQTGKRLYWLNFAVYITYCLIIGERDFIFPFMSILIHLVILSENARRAVVTLIGTTFAFIALGTAMFFFRDSYQQHNSILADVLNQGSLLFINTYTIKIVEETQSFFNGMTYWNSLLNLLPSWIYKTDFNTLEWFKNQYAPNSSSGYGYALDAEGYLNFGYAGVILTFLFIPFLQRYIFNRASKSNFFIYYSIFYGSFVMYCLRNDSLAFVKGHLYAIIFYFTIDFVSKIFHSGNELVEKESDESITSY